MQHPLWTSHTTSPAAASHTPTAAAAAELPTINGPLFAGMTRSGPDACEVWMHGDCTVWAPGVHIVGARIVGLESAVWTAAGHQCTQCAQHGAIMACLARGCDRKVHVPCARSSGWSMCESDFKTRCAEHAAAAVTAPVAGTSASNAS